MASSASTMPVLVDGEFVFPAPEESITLSQITDTVEQTMTPTLDVTLTASTVSLSANVSKGVSFEIQYSCNMNDWSTLITSTGEVNAIDFSINTSEIEENCAFFRIVTAD